MVVFGTYPQRFGVEREVGAGGRGHSGDRCCSSQLGAFKSGVTGHAARCAWARPVPTRLGSAQVLLGLLAKSLLLLILCLLFSLRWF